MTELLFEISSASYMAAGVLLVFSIVSFIRLRSIKDRGKFTYDDRLRMLEDIVLINTDEYIDSCKVQGRCISDDKSKKDNHQIFENHAGGSNYNAAPCYNIRNNKSR